MITENLQRVFPLKTIEEINALRQKFYIQFSTTLAEMMYAYAYPDKISERVSYENFDEINALMKEGNSILLCGGHFYNWEWIGMNLAKACDFPVHGIYKPLSNKYFDQYLKETRSKLGTHLLSMRAAKKSMSSHKKNSTPYVYALASDQSPTYTKKAVWEDFFGASTPFYPGLNFFAKTYNMPVFFLSVTCPKKGYYVGRAKRILSQNDSITREYSAMTEQAILADPVSWLWSHNRWKHVKD